MSSEAHGDARHDEPSPLVTSLIKLLNDHNVEKVSFTPGLHGSTWLTFSGAQHEQAQKAAELYSLIRDHSYVVRRTSGHELLVWPAVPTS